jgi:hypothetical protein
MATKFGEDVYAKIGNLLPGRRKGQRDDEHPIVLADPTTATVLEIPPRLSEKDTYALATVRMPSVAASQWLLIRYDPASRTWIATAVAAPPPDAIEVENQQ